MSSEKKMVDQTKSSSSILPSPPQSPPKSKAFASGSHPDFMFCVECTCCEDEITGRSIKKKVSCPPFVPNFPLKKSRRRNGKMTFIHSVDNDISNDSYDGGHKNVSIRIDNLNNTHQVQLIESTIRSKMGVLNCKTNFNNDDKMNRQVITITFDSTIISSEHIVETLIDLGLDAKIDQINSTSDRDDASSIICRSSFYVRGICCASEVPIVTNILRTTSRTAVKKVSINITARAVYVDHDPNIISATHLAECLTKEGFTSIVTRDGGDVQIRKGNLNELGLNKNQVDVKKILRASRSEAVEDSDAVFQLLEENDYLYQKVRFVSPHIASRTINIERDPLLESAQHVANYTNLSDLSDNKLNGMSLPASKSRAYGSRKRRVFRVLLPKHLGTNIVLSGLFWIISLIGALFDKFYYLKYAGLFSVLFGLPSVAMKALRTVKRWHFDANCMMTIAALGALALQEYDEAASVSFLFAISDLLEDQATIRARKALDTIVNLRPDHANLIDTKTGQISIISTHDLLVGSLVSVRTGDKIPSDGVVVEGESYVDESSLTGESIHMLKTAGSHVSGGTINVGSTRLVVKTTSLVEDSAVSRLVRLVEESASNRSPTEQIVDNFARSYTPFVICLAVIMCTFPWAFGAEAGRHWTLNGLIIVVIACPCALTISTPVTYAAGLAATAQKGIIVKGGSRLEALGAIKTIVFDKTGTLTEGRFRLNHLDVIGTHKTRHQILELLASMESHSSHPLAAALVHAAKQEGVHILNNGVVLNHTVLKGEGVMATVDGVEVYVGNSRLFQRIKLYDTLPSTEKEKALVWSEEGGTVGFLGIPGVGIMAMFCVADCVRKEAKGIISALLDDGVNVLMLTGDSHSAAKVVASEIGLPEENIRSHFLPEDKLHFVSSLLGVSKRKGHLFSKKELLLFCGDGINDAPALSIADVGVAMGEGAELAMETSDVTLMDSNLTKLLFSMKIGAEVIVTVQENIAISVTVKLIVIALTFAGKMTLLAAISSDVGVMLLVSINGMKLLPGAPRRCCKMRRNYAKTPIQPTILSEIVAQSFVPKKASSDLYLFRRQRPNHVDSNGALEKKSELASIEQIKKVDNDFDMLSDENEKKSTLKFGGKLSYESKPFPIPHDLSLLYDFLSSDEAEFILLSGGNNVTDIEYLTDDSMISDYMTRWKEEANRFGGELPRPGDSIVRVVPASIRILSVSILPKSVIGTTVIHNGILPEFQATLVDDTPTAQGPMPLVRLFNLIVNAGIKDKRNESAFLKLRVKMQEDNTCTFVADTEMYLEFNFPSLLLKLFPIKKEQSEKICSESIVNALKINLIPAIDSLYDKYLDYSAAHKEEDRGFQ